MRARIEGITDGPGYIDVADVDGEPPTEIKIQPLVTVRWGEVGADELTVPLAKIEGGVAVYRRDG